jgi:hypothetical protein
MSISIRSRKNKGRALQQYICKQIADIYEVVFDNQNEQCPIHSREMGNKGVDVILRGEIYNKFKYDIECKNCESPSIKSWIEQSKNNTSENRNFLLFWKHKGIKKPVVILDSEVFFDLIRKTIY